MIAAAIFAITVYLVITLIVTVAVYGALKKDSNRYDNEFVWVKDSHHGHSH